MKSVRDILVRRLEYKIIALILVVLIVSFSGIYFIMLSKERKNVVEDERIKSRLLADTIHETLDRDMMVFRADVVRFLIEDLNKLEGVKRIQIVRGNAPYVGEGRGQDTAFMDFKTLNDVHKRITTLYKMEWERDHLDKNTVSSGTQNPQFKEYFNRLVQTLDDRKLISTDEKALKQGKLDDIYFEEIDGVPVMTYLRPLPNFLKCALCHGMDHTLRGVLMISTSLEGMNASLKQTQRYLFTASAVTVVLLIVLLKVLVKRVVLAPVNDVVGRLKEVAQGEGDLTRRIVVNYQDEIGDVARWFNIFVEKLHHIISQVSQTSKQVKTVSQQILSGTKRIMEGANTQINAIDATSTAVESMNTSIKGVAENAESVTALAEESAVAVMEMSSSIDEIARSAAILSTSVEDSTASVLEMSSSIKQVDENVASLTSAAEATSVSMTQMDAAIKQIRVNVYDTVELSKGVTSDAERGRKATDLTIQGISKIQEYSQQVHVVIHHLNTRTENIGKILNVIDEVAEQTNLLALNAAIIAAQSGEHGKSFSVVAQEIKELADRTATSTGEIHGIIKALQEESQNAVLAINRSTKSVEEGVRLSEEAGSVLKKILESSHQSTERIQQIAHATDEQTQGIRQATEAMKQVAEMVEQIARATHEQSKGSEQIIGATEKMKEIATKVRSATHEQSIGNKQINEIVERVTRRVKEIAEATGKQAGESATILNAVHRIKVVIGENVDAIGNVGIAVEEMMKQAAQLSKEIDKFKL